MNPFAPQKGPVDKLKRNVYDLSFTSHITANFGTLYPVFCKKVSPGDSMSIETTFGLRAQPMIFPVQTKMRADIHYFYVRNRTLWSNFMDFYGKTKEGLVHPYIEQPPSAFKTGSIYDYLGVPTTIMSDSWYTTDVAINPYDPYNTSVNSIGGLHSVALDKLKMDVGESKFFNFVNSSNFPYTSNMYIANGYYDRGLLVEDISSSPLKGYQIGQISGFMPVMSAESYENCPESVRFLGLPNQKGLETYVGASLYCRYYFLNIGVEQTIELNTATLHFENTDFQTNWFYATSYENTHGEAIIKNNSGSVYLDLGQGFLNMMSTSEIIEERRQRGGDLYFCVAFFVPDANSSLVNAMSAVDEFGALLKYNSPNFVGFGNLMQYTIKGDKITDASTLSKLPWTGVDKELKVNAIPYRAYEAIRNSFYRNPQVSPFKINGQVEYNRYVTNLGDGADTFPYQLYQRNYEYDFLTGAFHSPQQGEAPLIGLTVNNKEQSATFQFSSSQINNGAVITATTSINDDGQVIGITGYDADLPQSNIDRLMTAINYGISINDIRQTNGLQKWLEKNIRRGYRYKDQLMSHFGVSPSFSELLMPEFIGGVSQEIKTDTIYQMATNENGYLGDYAGRAGVAGSSEHRVSKFCDEAGFIIGILSIVPTPVYSQVPAGYAFDTNLFDYFFPEFSKIGMQPIYNYQVTPLQSADNLHGVFGYQRPYWDLIRSIDEVHGEFRTTANGYVIQRHFAETPELNQHFTEINKDSMTDVFMITDQAVSNQFLGMIHFNCKRKTSIPMFGIPSIE